MRILVTGGTSFIGRNLLPRLKTTHEIQAPTSSELDVTNEDSVTRYLQKNRFDILIHLAAGRRGEDESQRARDMLRGFLIFEKHAYLFKKIIYPGSGAEFDQSHDIRNADEEDIGRFIPQDFYGFAKYTMNKIARASKNIYNMRIFGCYGPYEDSNRFIRHAITCCIKDVPVTIRRDKLFDYLFVEDLLPVTEYFMLNDMPRHDYNVTSGIHVRLSEIAQIVQEKMRNDKGIVVFSGDEGASYTACTARLNAEMPGRKITTLSEGIDSEIAFLKRQNNHG